MKQAEESASNEAYIHAEEDQSCWGKHFVEEVTQQKAATKQEHTQGLCKVV